MKYYHGTDYASRQSILTGIRAEGKGELGKGFYVGDYMHRACAWAWNRGNGDGTVFEFEIDATFTGLNVITLAAKTVARIGNNEQATYNCDAIMSRGVRKDGSNHRQIKFEDGNGINYINTAISTHFNFNGNTIPDVPIDEPKVYYLCRRTGGEYLKFSQLSSNNEENESDLNFSPMFAIESNEYLIETSNGFRGPLRNMPPVLWIKAVQDGQETMFPLRLLEANSNKIKSDSPVYYLNHEFYGTFYFEVRLCPPEEAYLGSSETKVRLSEVAPLNVDLFESACRPREGHYLFFIGYK